MRRLSAVRAWALTLLGLAVAPGLQAQLATTDPDWKEIDSPAPPAFSTTHLIKLDVRSTGLQFGIDPGSLSVGADDVVRYVVVASSAAGARTALFEGIRCGTGQVRTYARKNAGEAWVPVRDGGWQSLRDGHRSSHAHAAARQGLCNGNSAPASAREIVRALNATGYDK